MQNDQAQRLQRNQALKDGMKEVMETYREHQMLPKSFAAHAQELLAFTPASTQYQAIIDVKQMKDKLKTWSQEFCCHDHFSKRFNENWFNAIDLNCRLTPKFQIAYTKWSFEKNGIPYCHAFPMFSRWIMDLRGRKLNVYQALAMYEYYEVYTGK